MARSLVRILPSHRVMPAAPLGLLLLIAVGCSAPTAARADGHPLTLAVEAGLKEGKETYDHSVYDRLLRKHVSATGTVSYTGLAGDRKELQGYLKGLERADFSKYGREELLALIMNAYNALTLDWILENWPLESIRDTHKPWKEKRHKVGGATVSLDFLEHQLLRVPELFDEPRIHFGVNCASIGCPPLRNEAYVGAKVRNQLEDAAVKALRQKGQLEVRDGRVWVSMIFSWFGDDFRRGDSDLAKFLIPRVPAAAAEILRKEGEGSIRYLDYDWSLNGS